MSYIFKQNGSFAFVEYAPFFLLCPPTSPPDIFPVEFA